MSIFSLFGKHRGAMTDDLRAALEAIVPEYRRVSGSEILLGVKTPPPAWQPSFHTLLTRSNFPKSLDSAGVLLGPHCTDFVAALAASKVRETIEHLSIGWSHDLYGKDDGPLDLSGVSDALSRSTWPRLKHVSLGCFELLYNGHAAYGKLGNITRLLEGMPALAALDLWGNFQLDQPLHHGALISLNVQLDDPVTGMNGGPIAPATLENLLRSDLPALETISLDLECSNGSGPETCEDITFAPAESWLSGRRWPNLRELDLVYSGEADNIAAISANAARQWPQAKCSVQNVDDAATITIPPVDADN